MIDLATWNLSVPVGSPPYTVETSKLVDGFKDQYFHSDTGTLFFWSPVTGSTTDNAKYPRTELRETYSNGTLKNWLYPDADNYPARHPGGESGTEFGEDRHWPDPRL
jgi:Alginate lyase.